MNEGLPSYVEEREEDRETFMKIVDKQSYNVYYLHNKCKPMNKRSRFRNVLQRATCSWNGGIQEFTEWTCEGGLKPKGSRRRRETLPLTVGCA